MLSWMSGCLRDLEFSRWKEEVPVAVVIIVVNSCLLVFYSASAVYARQSLDLEFKGTCTETAEVGGGAGL